MSHTSNGTLSSNINNHITDTQMNESRSIFWMKKKSRQNITDSFYMIDIDEILEKSKLMQSNRKEVNGCLPGA